MRGSEHAVCGGDRFANSHKHDMTGLIRVMLVHHQILQGSKSLMWYHLFYHYYIIDIIFYCCFCVYHISTMLWKLTSYQLKPVGTGNAEVLQTILACSKC